MSFWNCILQWVYETNFLNEQGGIDSQLFTCCGSPAYAAPELVSGREYLGSEVRSRKGSRNFNGFWSRVLHFNFDNYFLFSLKFRIWMNCWHQDESCCPLIFICIHYTSCVWICFISGWSMEYGNFTVCFIMWLSALWWWQNSIIV